MAKRLSDIQLKVDGEASAFYDYLEANLSDDIFRRINEIAAHTEIFIFSGIIRNFFLKLTEIRDVDIMLEQEVDIASIFESSAVRKNSYGGYKIDVAGVNLDLWYLRDTWALKHQGVMDFNTLHHLVEHIPRTAFFNFSAVLYSFREQKFCYSKHFLRFIRDKSIDVVFKPNANDRLCVVNSIYYSRKYNLKLAKGLRKFIVQRNGSKQKDYEEVQQKHFGRILYSNGEVYNFIEDLVSSLVTLT